MVKYKVGFFPYGSEKNPYQLLIKDAIERNNKFGIEVVKVSSRKLFPYWIFRKSPIMLIHHFWPHDFYQGKNKFFEFFKQISYVISLPTLSKKIVVYSADNLVGHEYLDFNDEIFWIQKLISKSNAIVFTSNASKEIFLKYYKVNLGCELVIVPHVNYCNYYKNEITKKEARFKLNISPTSKVLLSLGRVAPYKGTLELIKYFGKANEKNSVLLICGQCTDIVYNQQIIEEIELTQNSNISIIYINRFIEDDDLQIYFNASDGVILNYKDVPMNPGSVILAMGFGCSIIAPNLGAIPEIVPEDCLFGFDPSVQSTLESAIKCFFSSQNLAFIGEKARVHVQSKHSAENVGKILSELYLRLEEAK
jgi:beta-1,4-mannosyltransferase